MATDDDDDETTELEMLDVVGAAHVDAEHSHQRDITHALVDKLEAVDAIIVITLRRGVCVTTAVVNGAVPDDAHPDVGAGLARGLRGCLEQIERALVHGGGNGGEAH